MCASMKGKVISVPHDKISYLCLNDRRGHTGQCTILRRVRVAWCGFKGVGHVDYEYQCGL